MNVVVIGAQWGDEGKGKIVDYLAAESDIVLRFSGGANAGHTIVTGDITYKLHLVPSGIIYPETTTLLGSAMVIDPEQLFIELAEIEGQGVDWKGRVFISDRAHLVVPRYKQADKEMETVRRNPIGTTGRGIGIAYAEKAHRQGIRVADVVDPGLYATLTDEDRSFLDPYVDRIREMSTDITSFMASHRDQHVLFEGAQGSLLDIDIGTYPYVSSGYSGAAGAAAGGGIGPKALDRILGVFKAYSTRVGNGPFPTEFTPERDGDLEQKIRDLGREYGVTTGRPRRCGYLDLVALRYACRANSIDSLVLTHLDVYDQMAEITACVAYEHDGRQIDDFPASSETLYGCKPVTRNFPGWQTPISEIQSFEGLPEKARSYVGFIEEFCETSIDIISIGYQREQTIIRTDVWTRS